MKNTTSKNEKLKTLAFMYIVPFISMIVFLMLKNIKVNDADLHFMLLGAIGFLFGMAIEGALFIIGVTIAVLFNKV